jgi:hypothetical protein
MSPFSVMLKTLLVGLTCLTTCIKADGLTVEKQLELLNKNHVRNFKFEFIFIRFNFAQITH